MYVMCCNIFVSAVTPIRSWNSLYAVLLQRKIIKTDKIIAPIGSIHHFSFEPPTLVKIPKPLINKSFLWSSHKMRTWLYLLRIAQQYKNKLNLVPNAMATAITEGKKKSFVSLPLCSATERIDSTIMTTETVIMSAQNDRLPAVSMRALPEGNLRASTRDTARAHMISVRFDKGSNKESAMVVNRDSDFELIAA